MKFDKTVLIDPGHGLFKTQKGTWTYQRPDVTGFREDLWTAQAAQELTRMLQEDVRRVRCTRPMVDSIEGQMEGLSGQERWKEGALYWVRTVLDGWPDYAEVSGTDYRKDVHIRPFYTNFVQPDLAVSLHVNAYKKNPKASGIEVWFRPGDEASEKLARLIYDKLAWADVRFDSGRGVRGDDEGWEISHSNSLRWVRDMDMSVPCVLIEFLFSTNADNNQILRDADTHGVFAAAVRDAIVDFVSEEG